MNLDGLIAKITEINNKLLEEKNPVAIPESQHKYFLNLIAKLRDPAIYSYIREFLPAEMDFAEKLLKWAPEHCIPVIDLWRILVTHHASQAYFSGVDSGIQIMLSLVSKLKQGPPVVLGVFLKMLSNMLMHSNNQTGFIKAKDMILNAILLVNKSDAKLVGLVANFIMNCSSALDTIPYVPEDFTKKMVELIGNLTSTANVDQETGIKLAIALGNFLLLKPKESQEGKQFIDAVISKIPDTQDSTVRSIVDGLKLLK
jgi:hypothetical protein